MRFMWAGDTGFGTRRAIQRQLEPGLVDQGMERAYMLDDAHLVVYITHVDHLADQARARHILTWSHDLLGVWLAHRQALKAGRDATREPFAYARTVSGQHRVIWRDPYTVVPFPGGVGSEHEARELAAILNLGGIPGLLPTVVPLTEQAPDVLPLWRVARNAAEDWLLVRDGRADYEHRFATEALANAEMAVRNARLRLNAAQARPATLAHLAEQPEGRVGFAPVNRVSTRYRNPRADASPALGVEHAGVNQWYVTVGGQRDARIAYRTQADAERAALTRGLAEDGSAAAPLLPASWGMPEFRVQGTVTGRVPEPPKTNHNPLSARRRLLLDDE